MFTLFVYFALFLHNFAVFFEDLFLIIAFILFLIVIFQLISTTTTTYFAERANHIRVLYSKLFTRRKEAIAKNKLLIKQLYLEQDSTLVSQYAALFYLKHTFNVKVYKEIEIKAHQTATQLLFIQLQQQLTKDLRTLVATNIDTIKNEKTITNRNINTHIIRKIGKKLKMNAPVIANKNKNKNTTANININMNKTANANTKTKPKPKVKEKEKEKPKAKNKTTSR